MRRRLRRAVPKHDHRRLQSRSESPVTRPCAIVAGGCDADPARTLESRREGFDPEATRHGKRGRGGPAHDARAIRQLHTSSRPRMKPPAQCRGTEKATAASCGTPNKDVVGAIRYGLGTTCAPVSKVRARVYSADFLARRYLCERSNGAPSRGASMCSARSRSAASSTLLGHAI
jgi:hypothetical protein